MRLEGKVAIVTGGGVGIGRAYCLGLAREGARVAVVDIQYEAAKTVAGELQKQGGESIAVPVDIISSDKVGAMVASVEKRFGRVDVLVNNAALYSDIQKKPFVEIAEKEWDQVIAVNVKGLFLCSKAVYPVMKKQGKGKIINISSGTILGGTPFFLHYVTSKAAVIGFTRALARELGPDNISVNAITPGLTISSPKQEGTLTPEQLQDRRRRRSFQRDQLPEDIVGTVIFLASEDSDFITGQTINVDGGMNMY